MGREGTTVALQGGLALCLLFLQEALAPPPPAIAVLWPSELYVADQPGGEATVTGRGSVAGLDQGTRWQTEVWVQDSNKCEGVECEWSRVHRKEASGNDDSLSWRLQIWGEQGLHPIKVRVDFKFTHIPGQVFSESAQIRLVVLEKVGRLYAHAELGQRIRSEPTDSPQVEAVLDFAASVYSNTEPIGWESVLEALRWESPLPLPKARVCSNARTYFDIKACESEAGVVYFVTVQRCVGKEVSCAPWLFGVEAGGGWDDDAESFRDMRLIAAQYVPFVPQRTLEELEVSGVCGPEPQIDKDLALWEQEGASIQEQDINGQHGYCNLKCTRVQVLNNSMYVSWDYHDQNFRGDGHLWGKGMWMEVFAAMLSSVLLHIKVPDVDFCMGEEYAQLLQGSSWPSFAMSKTDVHVDIMIPDHTLAFWGDAEQDFPHPWYRPPYNFIKQKTPSWDNRIPKLFWRGTVMDWFVNTRGKLCRIALKDREIFDVYPNRVTGLALTQTFEGIEFYSEAMLRQGRGVKTEKDEILRFKYVINTHGNGGDWSPRLRALLSSGAVVFKQDANLHEFWERELKPFVHYIPVRADLSDLAMQVRWAMAHDDEARRIAQNSQQFVRERVTITRVHCYWARLLTRYARLLSYTPSASPNSSRVINFGVDLWKDGGSSFPVK